jgi:hypothetical protein
VDSSEVVDEATKLKVLKEKMRAAALRLSGGISGDDPLAIDKRKVANGLKKIGRTTDDLPYDFWRLPRIARVPGERSRTNELHKISAEVDAHITGWNLPRPVGRKGEFGNVITPDLDLSYLPEPADEKALLAMALLREGRGLNHPGYAFLSSYRVLDVALPDPKAQMAWIDANLDKLTHNAKQALTKLQNSDQSEIGKHLYASGRCAMARAAREPIVDPDDPTDLRRLAEEPPIIMELAELAIETILGVETSQTVWENHLYELEGFRKLLGPVVVDHLSRGEQIPDGTPSQ